MGFHYTLALVFTFAFAVLLHCIPGLSSICGGIVSYAADFIQHGLRCLFRILLTLLCLHWSFQLRLPSGLACGYLFPLGVLLGFSGESRLKQLYLFDSVDHLGVEPVLLALTFVVFESFLYGDCVHPVSTLSVIPLVVMKDATVQVQFIPVYLDPSCFSSCAGCFCSS